MWFPKKYHYNLKTFIAMKVDLNVSAASKIVAMAGCPKTMQGDCGILYRSA